MERKLLLLGALLWAGTIHAQTYEYVDISNIKARVDCALPLFNNASSSLAGFEAPKGSNRSTIYSSGLWFGGTDLNGQLKMAIMSYDTTNNDFQPGPSKPTAYLQSEIQQWNKVWKITRAEIDNHILNYSQPGYTIPTAIATWPANGNIILGEALNIAPFFDYNADNYYDPSDGDYPIIRGDQAVYYIMNDYRIHTGSGADLINAEVHVMAYAFECQDSALSNTVFLNVRMINRGTQTLYNFKAGVFTDGDIGCPMDDYNASDISRSMYYFFNGDNSDQSCMGVNGYDALIPFQGVVLLAGLKQDPDGIDNGIYSTATQAIANNGTCYNYMGQGFGDGIIDNERFGLTNFIDPYISTSPTPLTYFGFMNSYWQDGTHLYFGGNGHYSHPDVIAAGNLTCNYLFPGSSDPLNYGTSGSTPLAGSPWSALSATYPPTDQRGLGSSGSVTLLPGAEHELDVAYVFAANYQSPSETNNHTLLNAYADSIHTYFKTNQTPCGAFIAPYTGITEEILKPVLTVYPNPATSMVYVQSQSLENYTYSVFDVTGKIMCSGSFIQSTSLQIDEFANGIYFIRITSQKKQTMVHKLIKQ